MFDFFLGVLLGVWIGGLFQWLTILAFRESLEFKERERHYTIDELYQIDEPYYG